MCSHALIPPLFSYSGTDILMDIALSNSSNVSPFLISGLWTKHAGAAKLHKSYAQFSYRQDPAGAVLQDSHHMGTTGFQENPLVRIENSAQRVKSTARYDSTNTLIFTDAQLSGEQGFLGASNDREWYQKTMMSILRSKIARVARLCDETMFKHIFGAMSVSFSPASGRNVDYRTEHFLTSILGSYTMKTDFKSNTLSDTAKGLHFQMDLNTAAVTRSDDGFTSLRENNKILYLLVPEEYMMEARIYLDNVRKIQSSSSPQGGDGTFSGVLNVMTTVNDIVVIGLPHTWFFTTGADAATRAFVGVLMTADAYNPYCPLVSENILQWGTDLVSARVMPITSKMANMDFPTWVTEETHGSYGSLALEDLQTLNNEHLDLTLNAMINAYDRHHPESNIKSSMARAYKPNSYKVYTSNMPASMDQITSYGSTLEVVRWAGGVRVNPDEMVSFMMPCALFSHDLSAYENTITETSVAMQTKSEGDLVNWLYENRDIVRKEMNYFKATRSTNNNNAPSLEDKVDALLNQAGEGNFKSLETKKVKTQDVNFNSLSAVEEDVKKVLSQVKGTSDLRHISHATKNSGV